MAQLKILAFQYPEFKILTDFKILSFQNPEFKLLADFKVLALQTKKSRFSPISRFELSKILTPRF